MRKVIFLMHTSLDGLVVGPNGEIDFVAYSPDLESFVHSLHDRTDTAIYGRVTYQMMEGYWPTVLTDPNADQAARNHAEWLDKSTKIVVSRTLKSVDWKNTVIIHNNPAEEITKIKQQSGKDLWLLASPTLSQELMREGVIDEYWITVSPVVLGKGRRLFENIDNRINLKLLETKTFSGGAIILRYEAVK
jgi:dihydrofolate reductase